MARRTGCSRPAGAHRRADAEQAGAEVVYREIADLSHTYPRDENGAILDWFFKRKAGVPGCFLLVRRHAHWTARILRAQLAVKCDDGRTCGFPASGFPTASLPAHGDTSGRLRLAVQLPRKSSDLSGVVRLFANHRPSTSSKARLKQGPFPPPALPGFSSTMTLSNSHRVRIAAAMEHKAPPQWVSHVARITFPTCRAHYPGGPDGGCRSTFARPYCLPRSRRVGIRNCTFEACSGFIRVRPTGSLGRPRRPLSRGFDSASYPATPLVSFQSYRPRASCALMIMSAQDARGPMSMRAPRRKITSCRSARRRPSRPAGRCARSPRSAR